MARFILAALFNTDLFSSDDAVALFKLIDSNKAEKIEVDFKNINFMSSSFAKRYLKLKNLSLKQIREVNESSEVKKMFETLSTIPLIPRHTDINQVKMVSPA